MSTTLSVSVTPEQSAIIKKIAKSEKRSVSSILKESIEMRILLSVLSEMISKMGFNEKTIDTINRDAKITEHAQEMVKLMQPYFEKVFSGITPEMISALQEEGKELEETIKLYNKPTKRGRPPALTVKTNKGDTQ